MPPAPDVAAAIALYVALFALPGAVLLRLLGVTSPDPVARAGLAVSAGMAIVPLAYLWADAAGLRMDGDIWWAVLAASAAILAVDALRGRSPSPAQRARGPGGEGLSGRFLLSTHAPTVAACAILALVLASRWWAARTLTVPLWGDSLQHTMIARLFDLQAGLPDDWRPLEPLSTFSYHFGLHAGVAALASLADLSSHRALLVGGQVLQVLQVLAAYTLAAGLTGRRWAGVGAALAAGGLSPMPAYYLNWGRYTQLAGQVLLPVALLALTRAATASGDRDTGVPGRARQGRRWIILAAILLAGLGLTHYLVTLFAGLFVLAWLGLDAASRVRRRSRDVPRPWLRLAAVAALAAALGGPWLVRVQGTQLVRSAIEKSTRTIADPAVYGIVAPSYTWGGAGRFVGWALLGAGLVAAVWGLWRRDRTVVLGVAWTVLLVMAAYPARFGLPVTGVLKDFTVAIGLYVPIGLIVGAALGDAASGAAASRPAAQRALLAGVVVLAAVLAWKDRAPVEAGNVLVAPADERAMGWIRRNTPPDAVFLVTCGPAFGSTVCAGEDAGWWIPLLADRRTTVPPITYGIEAGPDPGYRDRVNELGESWRTALDAPATRAALRAAGVTYAYVGTRPGTLDADDLAASPYWEPVYDRDGVRIFAGPSAAARDGARP